MSRAMGIYLLYNQAMGTIEAFFVAVVPLNHWRTNRKSLG
jgi:hypothetical protein